MRFQFSRSSSTFRLGRLIVPTGISEVSVETPGCLLYTRYGSVPFLPPDIYETLESVPNVAFIPMFYITERKSVIKKFQHGIVKFTGLGNRAALIFQTDPVDTAPVAAADKLSVPVWATGGRLQLSIEQYIDCALIAHPNGFQAPTDNDTSLLVPDAMSRKRCWNSVMRTARYLDILLRSRCENAEVSKIPFLVSIAGGNDLEARKASIKQTDFSACSGVVIDGISTLSETKADSATSNTLEQNGDTSKVFTNLIPGVCADLPENLPRFIIGVWQPQQIALAANSGVDLFDGSLPYRLTRSAVGWIYPGWSAWESKQTPLLDGQPRFLVFPLDGSDDPSDGKYETPIQVGCECFACTHHSRGYVSHMHIAKEMLGPMLLMIHNSHQSARFFNDLRHCLAAGKIDQFIEFAGLWNFPAKLMNVDRTFESKTANGASDWVT